MKPLKPNQYLIINDVGHAWNARKLGFEIESCLSAKTGHPSEWVPRFEFHAEKWRIAIAESGANAAKCFLPMAGDLCKFYETQTKSASYQTWQKPLRDFDSVERIVERPCNGEMVSFPHYTVAEIIEE